MTRMTTALENDRGELEDVLASLGVAMILINTQVALRMHQAIRRDHQLVDLLSPALDQLRDISSAIQAAQVQLGKIWKEQDGNH